MNKKPSKSEIFINNFSLYTRSNIDTSLKYILFLDNRNSDNSFIYHSIKKSRSELLSKNYKNIPTGVPILCIGTEDYIHFTTTGIFYQSPTSKRKYYLWSELSFIFPPGEPAFSETEKDQLVTFEKETKEGETPTIIASMSGSMALAILWWTGNFSILFSSICVITLVYKYFKFRDTRGKHNAIKIIDDEWVGSRFVDAESVKQMIKVGIKIFRRVNT